ncbi:MAG: sulfotransferase [Candidatus Sulfotelmatobacter sp.]
MSMNRSCGYKFVFLCGLHRSGTSPLFRILREHPEISGFRNTGVPEEEGQHLQTVYLPAKAHGGPGRFGFIPEAHLTENSPLNTPESGQKLFAEWSKFWDLSKPFLLEKSPPNLIRTRFLQAVFPESHFIVISRHPIAVSLATWKWSRSSLESLIEHWLHCHCLFEQDRPYLRHVLVIKYEDLICATEPALEKIYRFLGLVPQVSAPLNPDGNERYFEVWRKLAVERRGRDLCRRIVAKYEHKVQTYGYSLADCSSTTPADSSAR